MRPPRRGPAADFWKYGFPAAVLTALSGGLINLLTEPSGPTWLIFALAAALVLVTLLSARHSVLSSRALERYRARQPLPALNPSFSGRTQVLAQLESRLPQRRAHQGRLAVQVVAGLGGVGKTQVAASHLHANHDRVDFWWWVDASADPAAGFAAARELFGLPETASVHAVRTAFEDSEEGWLLVLDNVGEPAEVRDFLPQRGHGQVVITSVSSRWDEPPGVDVIGLEELEPDAAAELVLHRSRGSDTAAARSLAIALGGLPLALEQAAMYVRETPGVTLATYVDLLREHAPELFAVPRPVDHERTVAEVWLPGMDAARDEEAAAGDLLACLAHLGEAELPREWLLRIPDPPWNDLARLGRAIAALRRFSLVSYLEARDSLRVHRLVQHVTRLRLTAPHHRQLAADVIRTALESRDGAKDPRALSHALVVTEHGPDSTTQALYTQAFSEAGRAHPWHTMVDLRCLNGIGRSAEGVPHQTGHRGRALRIAERSAALRAATERAPAGISDQASRELENFQREYRRRLRELTSPEQRKLLQTAGEDANVGLLVLETHAALAARRQRRFDLTRDFLWRAAYDHPQLGWELLANHGFSGSQAPAPAGTTDRWEWVLPLLHDGSNELPDPLALLNDLGVSFVDAGTPWFAKGFLSSAPVQLDLAIPIDPSSRTVLELTINYGVARARMAKLAGLDSDETERNPKRIYLTVLEAVAGRAELRLTEARALHNLGVYELDSGRPEEARQTLKRALAILQIQPGHERHAARTQTVLAAFDQDLRATTGA